MKSGRQGTILRIISEQSIETQNQLMDELKKRGIDTTQATLSRDIRELRLVKQRSADGTSRYAAAEVAYFYGLGRSPHAGYLCLEGTPYILVEMPEDEWSPDTVEDLLLLRFFQGLRPIIVHVERCLPMQNRRMVKRLADEGVLFQCNAAFLASYETCKRQIKTLFRNDRMDLIGSDCHNMRTRKPNIGVALRTLSEVIDTEKLRTVLRRAADITRAAAPCC